MDKPCRHRLYVPRTSTAGLISSILHRERLKECSRTDQKALPKAPDEAAEHSDDLAGRGQCFRGQSRGPTGYDEPESN